MVRPRRVLLANRGREMGMYGVGIHPPGRRGEVDNIYNTIMSWYEHCPKCGTDTIHDRQSLLCGTCVYENVNKFWDALDTKSKASHLRDVWEGKTLEEIALEIYCETGYVSTDVRFCDVCNEKTYHCEFLGDCSTCIDTQSLERFYARPLEQRLEMLFDTTSRTLFVRYECIDVHVAEELVNMFDMRPLPKYRDMFQDRDIYNHIPIGNDEK